MDARALYKTKDKAPKASPELIEFRQHLDQRLGGLSVDRFSWWTHWREIADFLIPRRYKWLITPNQASRGSPINQRIIDNTGTIMLRVLAAGMLEGMTSPSRPWFKMSLDDPDLSEYPPVKAWLDEVTVRMRTVINESNFYTSMHTLNGDLGAFGTGTMLIYEDFEDVIRCYNSCAGEYYLANSDRMEIDTFYRMFVMTTKQVAQRFGLQNCSATVQQAIRLKGAGLAREVIVAHGVEPTDELTPDLMRAKLPFREAYWEYGQGRNLILSRRGFHENPVIAPRWDIVGNDAYGRSPGMDALGDIKQLQVEQKRKAQAIDKMVNPPMVADVELQNQPASLLPGGVTYVQRLGNDKPGFKPVYQVKPEIAELMEDIKECQSRIGKTFFYDLFLMISQMEGVQPRNELEILSRKEEKLIQLGPVVERFENEALSPALDRVFGVMMRAHLLPPPPKELRGQHIKTEYISMFAQAQKAAMTTPLEQFAGFVGRVSALNPEVADNLDTDELVDQYADHLGISPKVVRPIADVLKMRMQRAKQAQAQAMMEQTMAGVQGAKVLSETHVGQGKNALEAMLSGGAVQ